MILLLFIVLLLVISVFGWIYGEARQSRIVRVPSTIGAVIVFSGISAIVSGVGAGLCVGIPVTTALHEYLDASAAWADALLREKGLRT